MAGEGWNVMRFDRCACLVRDIVNPCDVRGLPYIGLEHIAEGQLALAGHGSADQVTSVKSRFRKGDILFGKLRPYFRKVVIAPFDGICSTDIWVVRRKQGIDQRYLFYWMATHEFIEESTRASEGTKMPRAQWDFVGRIEKLVPPIKEQQAIACILGALDDKIELNRRMNQTLEAMARAIFKSWFVDFDPVRAKAAVRREHPRWTDEQVSRAACPKLKPEIAALFPDRFENSALGPIPKGWRVGTLKDVIAVYDSKRIPISNRQRQQRRGPYPYYGAASQMDSVDDYLFDGVYILMGEDGSVVNDDGTPVLQYVWGQFWVNNHAHVLQGTGSVSTEHLLLHLKSCNIVPFVTGAVQPKLNQGNMNRINFTHAPEPINRKFGALITPLFARMRKACDESRTLAALRDTLLPKLISGELRVQDAERIAGRCV